MALHWDVTEVENFEEKVYYKNDDGELQIQLAAEQLIFVTMLLGLNEITKKNADEFFDRLCIWERCFGKLRPLGESYTLEEVRSFIGLKTNASSMSKAKFKNHVMRNLRQEAESARIKEEREKENAA